MKNGSELYQIVYSLLAAQIEFGTYRFGDPLPKMEETARWLSVSLDTVRAAYLQLKQNGYITLTKKAGAAVAVRFQQEEFEEHIQTFLPCAGMRWPICANLWARCSAMPSGLP